MHFELLCQKVEIEQYIKNGHVKKWMFVKLRLRDFAEIWALIGLMLKYCC